MADYDSGRTIRLSCEFTLSGTLTDPTTVTLNLYPPNGTKIVITSTTNDSVGKYHYDYEPPVAGPWRYKFLGTGTVEASAERSFYVKQASD